MSKSIRRLLACWGNGDHGRLGHGSDCLSADIPQLVAGLRDSCMTAISCGHAHTALVEDDGSVYTMGLNDSGQLGHSSGAEYVPEPREMLLPEAVTNVAAGARHTLFLTDSGDVWAVGSNSCGQLGLGVATAQSFAPRRISALAGAGIVGIAAGEKHSLALTRRGEVLSWGSGSEGQLGHGNTAIPKNRDEHHPRLISCLKGTHLQSIAAGMARSGCISDSGQAWTWGDNSGNELGHSTPTPASDPTRVDLTTISQLAFGGSNTLALFGLGAACRWGGSEMGIVESKQPLQHQRNIKISGYVEKVACGWKHSAAVTSDGRLFCWGWGGSQGSSFTAQKSGGGQLGLGDENDYWEPTQVLQLIDGARILTNVEEEELKWKVKDVSCGLNHTAAIVEIVDSGSS